MKSKLIVLTLVTVLSLSYYQYVLADEGQDHKMSDGTMMEGDDMPKEQMDSTKAAEVGNKICPVSGEKVGEMGEIVKHEYKGKIYNLCCKACAKDFKKDPEKYSKIADEEVKSETTMPDEEMGQDHSGHDHSSHSSNSPTQVETGHNHDHAHH